MPQMPSAAAVIGGFMTLMATSAWAELPAELSAVPADQGRIVVYRACGALGLSAIRPRILRQDRVVGRAYPSAYRFLDVAPGTHVLHLEGSSTPPVTVEVAAGEVHFLRAEVSTGMDLRAGSLQTVDAATAAAAMPMLSRVDR